MHRKNRFFLSYTFANFTIVDRFYESLRHYENVTQWFDIHNLLPGQNLLQTIPPAVAKSSHLILFWSQNALQKYNTQQGVNDLVWLVEEIYTAIAAAQKHNVQIIVVRLDESDWPSELLGRFYHLKYVNAIGLMDSSRQDNELIIWRAANEIIGAVRGRSPLYPPLEVLVNGKGAADEQQGASYFKFTWIGGSDGISGGKTGVDYIEGYDDYDKSEHRGTYIPAVTGRDNGRVYKLSVPNHSVNGWWSASVFFGDGGVGWRTVDLSRYEEMRFNARASNVGTELHVSFVDNQVSSKSRCGYQETSKEQFELGHFFQTGSPCILKLDNLDWSVRGGQVNTVDVDRKNVNAIVFNNSGKCWEPGARWIEVKNIVFV